MSFVTMAPKSEERTHKIQLLHLYIRASVSFCAIVEENESHPLKLRRNMKNTDGSGQF